MLPALSARYQPALAVMQSISTFAARSVQDDKPGPIGTQPIAEAEPKDMDVINDYYFGSHQTATEVMFSMMERLVGYLNDKLDVGRDGTQAEQDAGNAWRRTALADDIKVGSERDFSIPMPGEEGFSFRRVAQMIQDRFNLGALSQDRQLMKTLEQLVGFRLDGMNVSDLLQSFTDPDGKAAERVRDVIEDGLAGETGSKVSQRLEDAAEGPKSVAEAVDAAVNKKQTDEVDEETQAEDIEAIRDAKARQTLEKAAEVPEKAKRAAEAAEAKAASGPAKADDAQTDGAAAAAAIQALSSTAPGDETDAAPEIVTDETATGKSSAEDEAKASGANAAGEAADTLNALLRQYLDLLEQTDDKDDEPAFSIMI
jgi:hypothetical protein